MAMKRRRKKDKQTDRQKDENTWIAERKTTERKANIQKHTKTVQRANCG